MKTMTSKYLSSFHLDFIFEPYQAFCPKESLISTCESLILFLKKQDIRLLPHDDEQEVGDSTNAWMKLTSPLQKRDILEEAEPVEEFLDEELILSLKKKKNACLLDSL